MKIYKVAHENINYPKEYRKVEIDEDDVPDYIKHSVAYENMLEKVSDMSSAGMEEELCVAILIDKWIEKQIEEFYDTGIYDLGDFDLIIED